MLKAFAALDEAKQGGLKDDLHALIARMNKANDGSYDRAERVSGGCRYEAMRCSVAVPSTSFVAASQKDVDGGPSPAMTE